MVCTKLKTAPPFILWLLVSLLLGAGQFGLGAEGIRFSGPEIFPLEPRIGGFQAADLNDDGYLDGVIIDPRRARIQLLYNQTADLLAGKTPIKPTNREINDLPADARFRAESIRSERRISSLLVRDLVGDDKPDIVYCGNGDEIVVLANRGETAWEEVKKWTVPDITGGSRALQTADFDGDGIPELIALTETHFFVVSQSESRSFTRPQQIHHGGGLRSFQIEDINEDGYDDVLSVPSDNEEHVYLRLGGPAGLAASDGAVRVGQNRFLQVDNQLGVDGANVVSITQRSGGVHLSALRHDESPLIRDHLRDGALLRMGLPNAGSAKRGSCWFDLNDDQYQDLMVADPEAGKVAVYLRDQKQGYLTAQEFGSYRGIEAISVADWDGDDNPEVFILSHAEEAVGVSHWSADQGLPFPEPVDLEGRPIGIAVGAMVPGKGTQLAVVESEKSKLRLSLFNSEGLISRSEGTIPSRADRVELVAHDVDQDGLMDLVPVAPYAALWCFRQQSDGGVFEPVQISAGVGDLENPWVASIDLDGDGKQELVLPQKNAVRGVLLEEKESSDEQKAWTTRVKVQLNGADTGSLIGGAARVTPSGADDVVVALLDLRRNQLSFLADDGTGQWQVLENTQLPPGDYTSMSGSIGGSGEVPELRLMAGNQCFIKSLSSDSWQMELKATYESQSEDVDLWWCLPADLDADGGRELVFLDQGKHHVEVVGHGGDGATLKAHYRWPVFEQRSFRNIRSGAREPREIVAADFTGDSRVDLALIVHDRVLLYPQK